MPLRNRMKKTSKEHLEKLKELNKDPSEMNEKELLRELRRQEASRRKMINSEIRRELKKRYGYQEI